MRPRLLPVLGLLSVLGASAACGDDEGQAQPIDGPVEVPTDAPVDAVNLDPTLLSETGLYSDIAARTLAPGVVPYTPRWELFSDGAAKGRWIYLPPGTTIDTRDMDFWSFPQGTKLWKEFARGGVVIETRLLWKTGPSDDLADWFMVSYQWNPAGTDATAVSAGVVDDPGHNDIPSRSDCRKCHGPNRFPTIVLGFGTLQLDHDAPAGQLDLAGLVAAGQLSVNPAPVASGPYFPLPSAGAADPTTAAAFGYMHANCSGCHNARSELAAGPSPQAIMQLRLLTAADQRTSWAATPPYRYTVNQRVMVGSTEPYLVVPNNLAASTLYSRMTSLGPNRMPPVGRETADDDVGVPAVRAWIQALQP